MIMEVSGPYWLIWKKGGMKSGFVMSHVHKEPKDADATATIAESCQKIVIFWCYRMPKY